MIWIWSAQGSDKVHGPGEENMVAGEENLWFLAALKRSISELLLPEKIWKAIKAVFFKSTYISELLHFGTEITAPRSYENLPELPLGRNNLGDTKVQILKYWIPIT